MILINSIYQKCDCVNHNFQKKFSYSTQDSHISHISKRLFLELSIALSLNGMAMCIFNASMISIPAFSALIVISAGSILVEIIVKSLQVRLEKNENFTPIQKTALKVSRLSIANFMGAAGPLIAIHENGHALCARVCFLKATPRVVIFPFKRGNTDYAVSYGLTTIGKILGKDNSIHLTTAAGPFASLVFSMLSYGISNKIEKKHENISKLLTYQATAQLINELIYSVQGFLVHRADLGHDLTRLWKLKGIHPLISIGLMIALPSIQLYLQRSEKK